MTERGTIVTEPGNGTVEIFSLPTDETTLVDLVTMIFTDYWEHIHFGVLVQGAAWEVAAPNAPVKIGTLDGYITVDFGRWHFHLCLGEHTASGPELGRIRRCARAELYRMLHDDKPSSWGLRLFNSEDTQLMTVFFPNPWLDDIQHPVAEADWDRLEAWDAIRERFLGLPADPLDRTAAGFRH
jgi:hypothetical protein